MNTDGASSGLYSPILLKLYILVQVYGDGVITPNNGRCCGWRWLVAMPASTLPFKLAWGILAPSCVVGTLA